MTKEELIARLQDIEWDDFEVKEAKNELPKNIWETVSAFSNASGGWIIQCTPICIHLTIQHRRKENIGILYTFLIKQTGVFWESGQLFHTYGKR